MAEQNVTELLAQISLLSALHEAEKARADAEKIRADAEKIRADNEAAQKHEAIQQKERGVKRNQGTYWHTIPSLLRKLQEKKSNTAYEETVKSGLKAGNKSIFHRFLPSPNWLKTSDGAPLARDDVHRSAPEFLKGIWNESCKGGAAQRAHLVPFSFDCCMDWKCLFIPFVVLLTTEATEPGLMSKLCLCMMLGLKVAHLKNKFPLSGFLHSFLNFIPLCGQLKSLDNDPSIMFIPMLSVVDILFWNGKAYDCLIIGSDLTDMMPAGFLYVMSENGDKLVDTESFCELSANNPNVLAAFAAFRSLLLMVVPFLAMQALNSVKTIKAALCSIFRLFLAKQEDLMCPFIDEKSDKCVVCLKFAKREAKFPNFGEGAGVAGDSGSPDDGASAGRDSTVCPHPFLLFLRSLNAWFNFLHSNEHWGAWSAHFKENQLCTLGGRERTLCYADPLVILPSCRDINKDCCSCILCKAADVSENEHLYPDLSSELREAVFAVLYQAGPVSDEEKLQILQLRRGSADDSASADGESGQRAGDEIDKVALYAAAAQGSSDPDATISTRTTMTELPD